MRQLKIHTIPRSPGPIRTRIKRSTTVPRDGSQLTALRGAGFRKMGDVPHISQVRAPLTFSYVHAAQDQRIDREVEQLLLYTSTGTVPGTEHLCLYAQGKNHWLGRGSSS